MHEFLQVLNGKVALITSMIFFLLVQGTISCKLHILYGCIGRYTDTARTVAYLDYMKVESDQVLCIAVGLGTIIQWTVAASVPILLVSTCSNRAHDVIYRYTHRYRLQDSLALVRI